MNTQTQEPVAWTTDNQLDWLANKNNNTSIMWNNNNRVKMGIKQECKIIPLYTHPAPAWQELTDHDIGTISDEVEETLLADGLPEKEYVFEFARAIEQEIRERIHG